MQPRAEEIHRVLTTFADAKGTAAADGSRRRTFSLVVQGSDALQAEVREIRGGCAMIDVGSSIFTLAYSDILGMDPTPTAAGGLRITVRPGCFASHAAARLRRAAPRFWNSEATQRPAVGSDAGERRTRWGSHAMGNDEYTNSGAADGDPAGTESAMQDYVVEDALRGRKR